MFKAIQEQITYLYKEKRQPLLLAIDEAQYLSTGILNDINMHLSISQHQLYIQEKDLPYTSSLHPPNPHHP